MKLGFMTNVLASNGMNQLVDIANWATQHGFSDLEVGPTVPLDQQIFQEVIDATGIRISTLTYCRNFLSQDLEERESHRTELIRRIKLAAALGIGTIVTSTGINKSLEEGVYDKADSIRRTPLRSLDEVGEFFLPIVDLCERLGVKIAFENCPLMGNIAISPYMWSRLLEVLDSDTVGLAYDPSHLVWQGIDPYGPILEFGKKIIHFHAKDTIVDKAILEQTGFLTNFDWWRYCIPGNGEIDWDRIFKNLQAINYQGTMSIEHEDREYEGTLEKVQDGILRGKEFLSRYI